MERSAPQELSVTIHRSSEHSIWWIRPIATQQSFIRPGARSGRLAPSSLKAETSFELVGELIGVDAVIVGPAGSAKVTLILDTAAVMTTIVPSVAESIGLSASLRESRSVTRTAAAEERGYVVRSEISALGFTTPNHRTVVADLGYGIEGVLGINFLRDFNIELRFAERRILVESITP